MDTARLYIRGVNMKVTTWNNGSFNKTGAGYGIRIPRDLRIVHFNENWELVILHIEDKKVEVKLNPTFWTTCNELRNKEIGSYLIRNGLGEWQKGQPHELNLTSIGDNQFKVSL